MSAASSRRFAATSCSPRATNAPGSELGRACAATGTADSTNRAAMPARQLIRTTIAAMLPPQTLVQRGAGVIEAWSDELSEWVSAVPFELPQNPQVNYSQASQASSTPQRSRDYRRGGAPSIDTSVAAKSSCNRTLTTP